MLAQAQPLNQVEHGLLALEQATMITIVRVAQLTCL